MSSNLYNWVNSVKSYFTPTATYSKEDVKKTIEKLVTIKRNIQTRIRHIEKSCDEFLKKIKQYYESGNTQSAMYNLKLKKMYDKERAKWENICFNIDTHIFSIDSMSVILDTVDTLKDTTQFIKQHVDLSSIENIIDNFHNEKDVSLDLQSIFVQNDIEYNEKELLDELNIKFLPNAPTYSLKNSNNLKVCKKLTND